MSLNDADVNLSTRLHTVVQRLLPEFPFLWEVLKCEVYVAPSPFGPDQLGRVALQSTIVSHLIIHRHEVENKTEEEIETTVKMYLKSSEYMISTLLQGAAAKFDSKGYTLIEETKEGSNEQDE